MKVCMLKESLTKLLLVCDKDESVFGCFLGEEAGMI